MNPPSKEALKDITPHFEKFRQCVSLAFNDYDIECEHIRHKTTPTTRASIIRDNMVYHAKRLFADVKGADYFHRGQLFLLIINNNVCIKFKKLNNNLMPGYIPTNQALSYMNQVEIPEIPQVSKWVAGYRLDGLKTDIKDIFITYPMGAKNIPWHLELTPIMEKIVIPSKEEEKQKKEKGE